MTLTLNNLMNFLPELLALGSGPVSIANRLILERGRLAGEQLLNEGIQLHTGAGGGQLAG